MKRGGAETTAATVTVKDKLADWDGEPSSCSITPKVKYCHPKVNTLLASAMMVTGNEAAESESNDPDNLITPLSSSIVNVLSA